MKLAQISYVYDLIVLSNFETPKLDEQLKIGRLEGKVAIVTGGANGIGEATARLFAHHGARVVIADIEDEKAMQLVRELGEEVVAYKHCDVSEESDVQSLVAFTIAKWGKLDIMHNNAGILSATRSKEVSTMDMNDFDRVMSVNTRGMALGVKHASKVMIEAKVKGSIICTCSVAGIKGGTSTVAYTVSKHAVVGLMRAAASDLAKYGIRVNCLSPAGMVTPLVMKTLQQMKPSVTEKEVQKAFDEVSIFRGHSLSPLDIAQGALYLASDEAAFISGHNLIIDGGRTATLAPISV